MQITIAFHCNVIGLRGVEVATFDYAHYNETILGNKSIIIAPKDAKHDNKAVKKFTERFLVHFYSHFDSVEDFLKKENVTHVYFQKFGGRDNFLLSGFKNLVHVVFQKFEPHGDVYAYISKWLAYKMSNGKLPYVPYMVSLPDVKNDLKDRLGINKNQTVLGRHGGYNTFDIPFVKLSLLKVATQRNDIIFLFLNTDDFVNKTLKASFFELFKSNYGRKTRLFNLLVTIYKVLFCDINNLKDKFIFLEGTSDEEEKTLFINTCDAMIHARKQGETFGLACAEFSLKNKPVITFEKSDEKAHIDMLGNKAITYRDFKHLTTLLLKFSKNEVNSKSWDAYSVEYSPEKVMQQFKKVFLEN